MAGQRQRLSAPALRERRSWGVSRGRERLARGAACPRRLPAPAGGGSGTWKPRRTTACFWHGRDTRNADAAWPALGLQSLTLAVFLRSGIKVSCVLSGRSYLFERQASNWREHTAVPCDGTACPEDNIPGENY